MRVAFLTSEVHPFSKTGGLADVSAALPAALAGLGDEVTIFSPLYRSAAAALAGRPTVEDEGPLLQVGGTPHRVRYRTLEQDGCRFVFVVEDGFYDRPSLYVGPDGGDYPDNAARYTFLCRAALEYWLARGIAPDIVHLNDWPTALAAVYLRTRYRLPLFAKARCVFTVHNLAYQGRFGAEQLAVTGLDPALYHPGALEYFGGLNLMKGGLLFADALTTVSPSYALEIQTPAGGAGLDGELRTRQAVLTGILNGIDTRRWDPATDPHLPARYDAADLGGKAACKAALQRRGGLPPRPEAFVLAAISRFDWQKGMPLIADAMPLLAPLDVQLVLLGSGDAGIEARLGALATALPGRVSLTVGFDEPYAHLIEAGADAFLMPSQYEPCGLNQMYSQRYGTLPIVHATGGLRDTVVDASAAARADGTASGFGFTVFDAHHLAEAVLRAWQLFTDTPPDWRALMRHCMSLDRSWTQSATRYRALYADLP
jgi:starch synthase